jgi:hypothetical protein
MSLWDMLPWYAWILGPLEAVPAYLLTVRFLGWVRRFNTDPLPAPGLSAARLISPVLSSLRTNGIVSPEANTLKELRWTSTAGPIVASFRRALKYLKCQECGVQSQVYDQPPGTKWICDRCYHERLIKTEQEERRKTGYQDFGGWSSVLDPDFDRHTPPEGYRRAGSGFITWPWYACNNCGKRTPLRDWDTIGRCKCSGTTFTASDGKVFGTGDIVTLHGADLKRTVDSDKKQIAAQYGIPPPL